MSDIIEKYITYDGEESLDTLIPHDQINAFVINSLKDKKWDMTGVMPLIPLDTLIYVSNDNEKSYIEYFKTVKDDVSQNYPTLKDNIDIVIKYISNIDILENIKSFCYAKRYAGTKILLELEKINSGTASMKDLIYIINKQRNRCDYCDNYNLTIINIPILMFMLIIKTYKDEKFYICEEGEYEDYYEKEITCYENFIRKYGIVNFPTFFLNIDYIFNNYKTSKYNIIFNLPNLTFEDFCKIFNYIDLRYEKINIRPDLLVDLSNYLVKNNISLSKFMNYNADYIFISMLITKNCNYGILSMEENIKDFKDVLLPIKSWIPKEIIINNNKYNWNINSIILSDKFDTDFIISLVKELRKK